MNPLAPLAVGIAATTVLAVAPADAVAPHAASDTVTSCGYAGLQAGLATKLCADVTGNVVEFYGRVSLAGPPSPGSPAPAPKELVTSLSAGVVGGVSPDTQDKQVIFTSSTLEVRGLVSTVPCGSTLRGTFGVASYPWAARPVAHEITITC